MNKDHCCKECRRLGETTSLKGIARIIKSKHIVLKILWTVCTVTFVFLALYQATVLLMDFFSYPETTDLDERSIDPAADSSVLPQITVCSLNPLSTRATENPPSPGVITNFQNFYQDGLHFVEEMYQNSTEVQLLRRQLLKPRGYFGILGREGARIVGHTQDEFIASCKVLVVQGLDLGEEECSGLVNITLFQHSKYFNCYTIAMNEQTPENVMIGYSLTLHLANFQEEAIWFKLMDSQRKQSLGALVAVHAPRTFPLIIGEGHMVAPGTHVNLQYSLEERNRLPEPHGSCQSSEKFLLDIDALGNISLPYKYTKSMCESVGLEYFVARDCNCTDYTLMQLLDDGQLPGCSDPNQGDVYQMMDQLICARNIRRNKLQEVMGQCPEPCHQLRYIPSVSESIWPAYPLEHNFYDELIAGRPYEDHYAAVKKAIDTRAAGMTSQELASLEAHIKKNFVNMNIYLGRLRMLVITDSPKLTRTSLMSQLGGTLNLWAGITIVLIIEFIEYLLRTFVLPEDA